MKVLWFFSGILVLATAVRPAAAATFYVDIKNTQCSDAAGSGTQTRPYCSLNYVSTIANPGDTFLIQSGRYGDGPAFFKRSGTATAPITYKGVGDVVIGSFFDVRDEDFKPTATPHVYSLAWTHPVSPGRIHQTYFEPILVDDPNQSIFTLDQKDGPMMMTFVNGDRAVLAAQEGTFLYDSATKTLFVHPYGNRVPSATATDLVAALTGNALTVEAKVQYNVFDGFRIPYQGAAANGTIFGSHITLRNMTYQGNSLILAGSNNVAENITASHGIFRGATWLWYDAGGGGGIILQGHGHRLKNIHVFHNWNSGIGTEKATGVVVDGARIHGAPNHCSGMGGYDGVLRNAVLYNCQDYIWLHDINNTIIEHAVIPGAGIGVEAITRPLGPLIVRNSIFSGSIVYIRGLKERCTWEKGSIMENNIISKNATIERCSNGVDYPILTYMEKCASGEFTDCMTIRNNQMIDNTAWKTVIKDGMWNASLGDNWDVHLVANSPAIDRGMKSGTNVDITGTGRPQGGAFDIGAYEVCTPGQCAPPPPLPPPPYLPPPPPPPPPPSSMPTLKLNLPLYLPINAQINATYTGSTPAVRFVWDFTPIGNTSSSSGGNLGAQAVPAARLTTPRPQADLGTARLGLGPYRISVTAYNSNNGTIASVQANVTMVAADLANVRAYPNPWRSNRHTNTPITFDGLTANTTVKIFTLSGHWVKTLPMSNTNATWDLTTHKGDKVASGIYVYLLTTDTDQKKTGQLHIIK